MAVLPYTCAWLTEICHSRREEVSSTWLFRRTRHLVQANPPLPEPGAQIWPFCRTCAWLTRPPEPPPPARSPIQLRPAPHLLHPPDSHPPDFPLLRAPNPNRASPIPRVPAGAYQTHAIRDLSQNALLNLSRYEWGRGAGTNKFKK